MSIFKLPFLVLVCGSCSGLTATCQELSAPDSELAGAEAARILGVLASSLETGKRTDTRAEHFAPGFTCGPLRPGKPVTFYEGPEATVMRWNGDSKVSARGAAALDREWSALLAPWKDSAERHVKVKVVRVDLSRPGEVLTRQLFTLTAQTPDGPVEHNATWEAGWVLDKAGPPGNPDIKLKSLRCLGVEESRGKGRAWLADCTEGMLGGLPWFREQLGRGNAYWRARLQKEHEQFVWGHHGIAVGDANGDGLDDLYLCMEGGLPNRLLLQQPDGSVRDASRDQGVDFHDHTRAALLVDLDGDADNDMVLAITRGILILENDGRRFQQKALLPRVTDAYSLAATDYDGNGTVDFYGCGYRSRDDDPARVAIPVPFYDAMNGGENFLVRNDGGWKFTNATAETGLDKGNSRFSFAAAWTDFDNDGDQDLFVANDFGRNNLYEQRRDGAGKITFVDVATERGLGNSGFGMSVSVADYNRDGALDFYVGNMFSSAGNRITHQPEFKKGLPPEALERFRILASGNALYLADGKGGFKDEGPAAGVNMGRWTWGTLAPDLNCDGFEDLLVGNGAITGHAAAPDL